jgi:hypothetical protein
VECNRERKDEDQDLRELSGTHLARLYIKEAKARPNVDPIPGNTPEKPVDDGVTGSNQHETNTLKQKKPHWAAFRSS